MYSVSSAFTSLAAQKNAEWLRSFLIGSSDYATYVMRWPSFENKWDAIRPSTPSVDCQNENGEFNVFISNPTLMRSSASLRLGLQVSPSSVEWLTLFTGTLDALRFAGGGVSVTLIDKFKRLADLKIGDTTTPTAYTSSAHFIHDMAWYVCTSHGGLSATADSSNPDLDYPSWSSWAAVFSVDNVRCSANFTGQTPLEGLKKLAELTQSAIFIQDGKITFQRFSLVGADSAVLSNENTIDVNATLDDRMLVNKSYVSGDYDVTSKKFNITTLATDSVSVDSYGIREKLVAENFVWLTDSISTLNLCDRIIQTQSEIKPRFLVKAPLDNIAITIGDTLGFVDAQLNLNNSFRVMEEKVDMDTGAKSWVLDQTQYIGAFKLDISALDGADILT